MTVLTRGTRRIRAAYQGRRAHGRPAARRRVRDEAGMTLMELLVASSVLVVLLTAVAVSMNMLDTVSSSLSSQYQEYDTALPAFQSLQSLIRAEVEPAQCSYPNPVNPCSGTNPTPGFQSIGNSSVTFTANIGTSYGNVTASGLTAGPAQITAGEFNASGAPVTTSSTCTVSSPCTFQVREYLPALQPSGLPTCPTTENPGGTCQWPQSTYTLITNVQDVTNSPSTQPIFTYTVANPLPSNYNSCVLTQAEVQGQQLLAASSLSCGYPSANGAAGFACALPTTNLPAIAVSCPLDSIQSVGINLLVANKGSGTSTIDSQDIFYRYQQITGSSYTYTYPYTPGVG
jgi:hypothetical protein